MPLAGCQARRAAIRGAGKPPACDGVRLTLQLRNRKGWPKSGVINAAGGEPAAHVFAQDSALAAIALLCARILIGSFVGSMMSRIRLAGMSLAVMAGALIAAALVSGPALAEIGAPMPWQMDLQKPVTENMAFIKWFHDWLLVMCFVISFFVLGLLLYAMWRFSEARNPNPSRTTHHAGLEVAWTVIPILILVVIAIPSFKLLKFQLDLPKADVTLKVTGKQWFWTWDYPQDQGGFTFDQLMLAEADWKRDVAAGKLNATEAPRLLAVDNEAVVPVGKVVRVQVTAADVIHKFALPSFGLKIDAIPAA